MSRSNSWFRRWRPQILVGGLVLVVALVVCVVWFRQALEEWWDSPDTHCVAIGSLISTPDGETAVEDLRAGDLVLSVDPRTGSSESVRVTAIRRAQSSCLHMETESGCRLIVSAAHPVYAPEEGRYVRADRWLQAEPPRVAVMRGRMARERVVASERLHGERTVFDISVDGTHRNFLANGVLVHNKTVPREPLPVEDEGAGR